MSVYIVFVLSSLSRQEVRAYLVLCRGTTTISPSDSNHELVSPGASFMLRGKIVYFFFFLENFQGYGRKGGRESLEGLRFWDI